MCEVCAKKTSLEDALASFLREGVTVTKVEKDEGYGYFEEVTLTLGDKSITVTADGDAASYFHWSS